MNEINSSPSTDEAGSGSSGPLDPAASGSRPGSISAMLAALSTRQAGQPSRFGPGRGGFALALSATESTPAKGDSAATASREKKAGTAASPQPARARPETSPPASISTASEVLPQPISPPAARSSRRRSKRIAGRLAVDELRILDSRITRHVVHGRQPVADRVSVEGPASQRFRLCRRSARFKPCLGPASKPKRPKAAAWGPNGASLRRPRNGASLCKRLRKRRNGASLATAPRRRCPAPPPLCRRTAAATGSNRVRRRLRVLSRLRASKRRSRARIPPSARAFRFRLRMAPPPCLSSIPTRLASPRLGNRASVGFHCPPPFRQPRPRREKKLPPPRRRGKSHESTGAQDQNKNLLGAAEKV